MAYLRLVSTLFVQGKKDKKQKKQKAEEEEQAAPEANGVEVRGEGARYCGALTPRKKLVSDEALVLSVQAAV